MRINGKDVKNPFGKNMFGDIFGTQEKGGSSMLGMMYRTRILSKKIKNVQLDVEGDEKEAKVENYDAVIEIDDDVINDDDSILEITDSMGPREQLAMTIRNWAVNPANDEFLINEGAVHALIALATMDDPKIKTSCASAFYHLSDRKQNREKLLQLGAAAGVISVAMGVKKWRLAKQCAMALCNLSTVELGETILAKEGGILALLILLGVRGQKLLPVCSQALYNMTCVSEHFKGLDRILKALMNLPPSAFDYSLYLLQAIFNCARFSWMRLRIIEDGVVNTISHILSEIGKKERRGQVLFFAAKCLRTLSESVGARSDLLGKNCMDLLLHLAQLAPGEAALLLIIKTVHNLLVVPSITNRAFEAAVEVVDAVLRAQPTVECTQYAGACLTIFMKLQMRGSPRLTTVAIRSLNSILESRDQLTQYSAISAAGNLFFIKGLLNSDFDAIQNLMVKFVETGLSVRDSAANQALILALAKLAQEPSYMDILGQLGLYDKVVDIVMTISTSEVATAMMRNCACAAFCRLAVQIGALKEDRRRAVADFHMRLLASADRDILFNAVSSIRALSETGICEEELASPQLWSLIASIAAKHQKDAELCRMCCALVAQFSYDADCHQGLAADGVLQMLFRNAHSEDVVAKELVVVTLCNVSVTPAARERLILSGVAEQLAHLSGGTRELLHELCAKCICNLTCAVEHHQLLIKQNVLHTLLMISLVRAVGSKAKLHCACAALNMVTDENVSDLRVSGVVRVFSAMSQGGSTVLQLICAKGFFLFTMEPRRREDIAQRLGVLQGLYAMVESDAPVTKIITGLSICNLLSDPCTQLAGLQSGALAVLKLLVTLDYAELREGVVRVICSLSNNRDLTPILLTEPLVPILVYCMQADCAWTFECALAALASLCQAEAFRGLAIDCDCVAALVTSVLQGKVLTADLAAEICRIFTWLSYEGNKVGVLLKSQVFLAVQTLLRLQLCSAESMVHLALLIRNATSERSMLVALVEQGAFALLQGAAMDHSRYNSTVLKAALRATRNLVAAPALHAKLVAQGAMQMLLFITREVEQTVPGAMGNEQYGPFNNTSEPLLDASDISSIVYIIQELSMQEEVHEGIVGGGAVMIFALLLLRSSEDSRQGMAAALAKLASTKACRQRLVDDRAPELIIELSKISHVMETQAKCSLALGHLSDITRVKEGVVESLLLLSLRVEDGEQPEEAPPAEGSKAAKMLGTTPYLSRSTPKDLRLTLRAIVRRQTGAEPAPHTAAKDACHLLGYDSLQGEYLKLRVDYSEYSYSAKNIAIGLETGGMVQRSGTSRHPLPSVSPAKELDFSDNTPQLAVGSNVIRGPNWLPAFEDGGEGSVGLVSAVQDGVATVLWPTAKQGSYRYGRQDGDSAFYKEVVPIDRNAELPLVPVDKQPTAKDCSDKREVVEKLVENKEDKPDEVKAEDPEPALAPLSQRASPKQSVSSKRRGSSSGSRSSPSVGRRTSSPETLPGIVNDSPLPGAAWRKNSAPHN